MSWKLEALIQSEDKGLRGQRPSKSKTIEKQPRFIHGDFGELDKSQSAENENHKRQNINRKPYSMDCYFCKLGTIPKC